LQTVDGEFPLPEILPAQLPAHLPMRSSLSDRGGFSADQEPVRAHRQATPEQRNIRIGFEMTAVFFRWPSEAARSGND